jgi:hypothetical protein
MAAAMTTVPATKPTTAFAVIVPPINDPRIPPVAAAAAADADAAPPAATDPAAFCAALTAMACMTAVVLEQESVTHGMRNGAKLGCDESDPETPL